MTDNMTTSNVSEKASWFVGKMERGQAEQFLMEHGRQREFLVRERTARDGYYALSIRYHYSCKHFNIDPKDGQFCMGALTFSSIEEVIRHYQQNSLFIHDNQHVTLGQPVKKRTRHSVEKHSINA